MTNVVHPVDARPIVALFCTRGMEAFLSNALQGMLRVGVDPGQIYVGCPNNALESVSRTIERHSDQIHVISNRKLSQNEEGLLKYCEYRSRPFVDISWKKIVFIKDLIELHHHVIYADLDVAWIRNPLAYLVEVASAYPMAFQTEGVPRFPPSLCCGFMSFLRSERSIAFLNALIEFDSTAGVTDDRISDQVACDRLVDRDVTWLRHIFCLPEMLFLNGLGHRNLDTSGQRLNSIKGESSPFIFHANWTVGADKKRELLAQAGLWSAGDVAGLDQGVTACGSFGKSAPETQAKAPAAGDAPLLTVIYPVFDTRGDPIERVRLWTQEQNVEPHRYCVFVVGGAGTDLDETRLRKVLRVHDRILRVPKDGREADYWNAGARETTTPWLLFVEAHCVPKPDSLSALATWIDSNPDGEACNFMVENSDRHRLSKLMKRWFAEVHAQWADRSTWPRLHRVAFAIRRDVFEGVGPMHSEYGQFAPQLLSARLHQRGVPLVTLPTSGVIHDDSPEMSAHHDDTADFVRGEMNARANSDPVSFQRYFGSSPLHGQDPIVSARHARIMLKGILVAAINRPADALRLSKRAPALVPAAMLGLRLRARLLARLTRMDELAVMHMPLPESLRWERFLLAHRRVVRTEQMLWLAQQSLSPLQPCAGNGRRLINEVSQHAIVGLHEVEYLGDKLFHWTHPVFLLQLALPGASGSVTLETRNMRRDALLDIIVVAEGRMLASDDIEVDDMGNIHFRVSRRPSASVAETNVVVITRKLRERIAGQKTGRILGLPLFSIQVS
jgi:hypothetical protein